MLLNSCHPYYYGYGVSPVDSPTLGIVSGRPYGGVGFLWKKGLDANVSIPCYLVPSSRVRLQGEQGEHLPPGISISCRTA